MPGGNPHRLTATTDPNLRPSVDPDDDMRVTDRLMAPLALILVLNPLGAAMVATGFGGRSTSLRLGRVWWFLATMVLVAVALIASTLLDVLDISLPSWQFATVAIIVVSVVSVFVQRDPYTPSIDDDSPEWLAILWGIGWLATPGAVAVVIAQSVDLNPWIALVAAAIAVTFTSIGALLGPALLGWLGYVRLREMARWSSLFSLLPGSDAPARCMERGVRSRSGWRRIGCVSLKEPSADTGFTVGRVGC